MRSWNRINKSDRKRVYRAKKRLKFRRLRGLVTGDQMDHLALQASETMDRVIHNQFLNGFRKRTCRPIRLIEYYK